MSLLRHLTEFIRFFQHYPRLRNQLQSCWCWHDAFVGALKERQAKLIFEFLNLGAQSRLTDMASFGGSGKVIRLCQGHDIQQVLQRHRSLLI